MRARYELAGADVYPLRARWLPQTSAEARVTLHFQTSLPLPAGTVLQVPESAESACSYYASKQVL